MKESGEIKKVMSNKMNDHDPNTMPKDDDKTPNHLYSWVRTNAKVTLYLSSHWTTPKQGHLDKQEEEWYFIPGQLRKNNKPIHLPKFAENVESMIQNRKLFQGRKTTSTIINACQSRCLSNIAVAVITARRHVSAKDLIYMKAPSSLLQHAKMHRMTKQHRISRILKNIMD